MDALLRRLQVTNYDHTRFVYETPIHRHTKDALASAAAEAIERSRLNYSRHAVEPLGHAFRIIDNAYATCIDPDGDSWGSTYRLEIIAFPVVKRTDKGFRIWRGLLGHGDETRWVSFGWMKQWASLTPAGALAHFIARKRKQASIYEARAANARYLQREAEAVLNGYKDHLPL